MPTESAPPVHQARNASIPFPAICRRRRKFLLESFVDAPLEFFRTTFDDRRIGDAHDATAFVENPEIASGFVARFALRNDVAGRQWLGRVHVALLQPGHRLRPTQVGFAFLGTAAGAAVAI